VPERLSGEKKKTFHVEIDPSAVTVCVRDNGV
jgi:hypothetical protein